MVAFSRQIRTSDNNGDGIESTNNNVDFDAARYSCFIKQAVSLVGSRWFFFTNVAITQASKTEAAGGTHQL